MTLHTDEHGTDVEGPRWERTGDPLLPAFSRLRGKEKTKKKKPHVAISADIAA